MHDSDSGIGTNSGMIPFLAGIGIEIKKTELYWNRNRNWNRNRSGIKDFLLESEPESEILKMLESESEPESRHARNRASLSATGPPD